MSNEDYVNYELALKLKACGFDEPCDHYYHIKNGVPEDDMWFTLGSCADFNNYKRRPDDFVSVPFLWHAQKWLREVKGVDVLVWNCACGYGWEISKADPQSRGTTLKFYDDNGEDKDSGMWLTYEQALSAGIVSALELIEQENK